MRTLTSFQNVHSGERIVVCGCGVSLQDFERPERFITIGVNDVGRLFQPKYLLVADPKGRFKGDRFHYVETSQAEFLFTQMTDLGISHPNIVNFRLGKKEGTDFSNPHVLHYGVVSPYIALYLAAYMGATRIGLIGVDFTDHHFFGNTGPHPWTPHLASIDEQFHRLGAALLIRGIKVFNLSRTSRLTAFPKMSLETFATLPVAFKGLDSPQVPLRIVSYSTTPVAGVPAILARCINARTPHYCRCLWAKGDYGNGVVYEGDINWNQSSVAAMTELTAANVVLLHNGKVNPQHAPLLAGKTIITVAHNYMWNVSPAFIHQGFPGAVVGQYQATLPEFKEWLVVPNPVPLWEEAFQPGKKDEVVTISYTPSGKHEQYSPQHRLYWHSKGYDTTMRILEKLANQFPTRLEVIRDHQVSHAEALAMKRRAHIIIDECVTGSYHRNSLEGLAAGCVVVNGVGLLPGVASAIRQCVGAEASIPFTYASLETLEEVLTDLIKRGPDELAAQGARNREWMEQHWDFAVQWERFWSPIIAKGVAAREKERVARSSRSVSVALSVIVVSHNEGEYLRRTVDSLAASLPDDGEIIVVDDGSGDGSADFLVEPRDCVTLLRPAERLGAARARNFGAQHARGKILAFSDAHVAVPPDWAKPLSASLGDPDVGAVMPAIRVMRYPDDYTSTNHSKEPMGYGLRWRDAALSLDWLGCKGQEPYPVPLIGAAFMAMRRNLFASIGGFDSGLVVWGSEDAELSLRLWTLGYVCLVVPGVDVAHHFPKERPYRVEWEMVLYNKLRLAAIHFGPERERRVLERLRQNGELWKAMARLASSDVDMRRSQMQALRRYDDDWFFQRFSCEMSSELAVIR